MEVPNRAPPPPHPNAHRTNRFSAAGVCTSVGPPARGQAVERKKIVCPAAMPRASSTHAGEPDTTDQPSMTKGSHMPGTRGAKGEIRVR